MTKKIDTTAVINQLNKILEFELAGVVRYTHYFFMVFGYNRIPIIGWMEEQAAESLSHAKEAGELITHLGGCLRIVAVARESGFESIFSIK